MRWRLSIKTYKVLPVPLPDSMTFAGEKVPMNHFGVRENLEQEMLVNIYWQSQTMLCLKRANRYFPEIEKILKKNGVPSDFKYLAMAESGFQNKVSQVGAAGFGIQQTYCCCKRFRGDQRCRRAL